MNILEICLSPAKGGLELYAYRAALELAKTDNVTAVVVKDGELEKLFRNSNIGFLTSIVSFRPFPIIAAVKLAKAIVKHDIEIIHVHWVKDLPLVALAKKLCSKKPKIIFTRQMQITRDKKDFYHRFVYREVDKFIAITRRVASDLRNFLPDFCADKIDVLYYGVPEPKKMISDAERGNIRDELGLNDQSFLVGIFGRIKKEKGQYLVIDAVAKMHGEDKLDVAALIVGHPMSEKYLLEMKQDVESRGLHNNIKFMDFVADPQSLMQVCDVVVLATYEETFGLVLAEAMRSGIAVVGSNSGGVPEIINDKEDGLLFETKNAEDLYRCLKSLDNDRNFLQNIALRGKAKADKMFNDKEHFIKLRKLIVG